MKVLTACSSSTAVIESSALVGSHLVGSHFQMFEGEALNNFYLFSENDEPQLRMSVYDVDDSRVKSWKLPTLPAVII
jgi:hypothetical protein